MHSNILDCILKTLGHDAVRNMIRVGKDANNSNRFVQVSNPVLRYLINTTYEDKSGNLLLKRQNVPFDSDRMHYLVVGSLMKDLEAEINKNQKYLKETIRGLLNVGAATYYSQLNELIVGGFYKTLKLQIVFNDNTNGLPDIDVLSMPFATDVKLFKNNRINLDIAINESRKEIEAAFKNIQNETLTFYMLTHEIKKLRSSLILFSKKIKNGVFTAYQDENCIVSRYDSSQEEDVVKLFNKEDDLYIGIKANWPMDESVEEYRKTVDKATEQALKADKLSLPWILFLDDANRHGSEMTVIRIFGKFHLEFADNPQIDKVINYSFSLKGEGKFGFIVDPFEIGRNTLGINQENFGKYLSSLLSFKELLN